MELLILLVEKPGQLVSRDEIVSRLWGNHTFLDTERSINSAIRKIRVALHDDSDNPRYLQTVVGKGYRFVGPIHVVPHECAIPEKLLPDTGNDSIAPRPLGPAIPKYEPRQTWLWAIAAVGLILAAAISAWVASGRPGFAATSPRIRSLAVLPLENLSGDAAQDYFADGMTDELVTDLAGVKSLHVISRTSVMQYKGTRKPLSQIARELKVDALVEGSVVRSGDRVRITAQLIQASTDHHLWAQSFERDSRDVLSLQRDVAQNIANHVQAVLTPREQAYLARSRSANPEAYEAYLKGRYYWNNRTEDGFKKGLEYFALAIQKDPEEPLAYVGLADSYSMLANYFLMAPSEAFPKAEAAAQKALALDDSLAEAHTSLAYAKFHYDWDWAAAQREFTRAIDLNPSYATAHQWYAEFLAATGRFDQSLTEIRAAQQLDPFSLVISSNIGRMLYLARRYDQAIQELHNTIELNPNQAYAHVYLGSAYEEKHMYAEAEAQFKAAAVLFGTGQSVGLAHVFAISGRHNDVVQMLKKFEEPSQGEDPFFLAGIHAALGQPQQAFRLLDLAYRQHDFFLSFIKVYPWMDPLRDDPRFSQLLSKMGLN